MISGKKRDLDETAEGARVRRAQPVSGSIPFGERRALKVSNLLIGKKVGWPCAARGGVAID